MNVKKPPVGQTETIVEDADYLIAVDTPDNRFSVRRYIGSGVSLSTIYTIPWTKKDGVEFPSLVVGTTRDFERALAWREEDADKIVAFLTKREEEEIHRRLVSIWKRKSVEKCDVSDDPTPKTYFSKVLYEDVEKNYEKGGKALGKEVDNV